MKMISKLSSALLLLCLCSHMTEAQDYHEYMNAVERQNAAYLAEKYQIDIAQALTAAASVFNDPTLSIAYGNNQDWSLQMGQSVETEIAYSFSLGNVRKARMNVAKSEEEITRAAIDDWLRNLKADATIAWVHAQEARSLADVKRSSYESMLKVADSDSTRASLGDGSRIDAKQSRIESRALYADYLSAEADYENALQALSLYAGGMHIKEVGVNDILLPIPSFSPDDLVDIALDNRADLRAAELSRTLSKRNQALVNATRAPEIELNAGYSYNTEVRNEIAPAPLFHGLTVGVAFPLKFSRFNRGEKVAAEKAVQQAESAYEAAQQQIISEVKQAWVSWQAANRVAKECSSSMLEDAESILESRRAAYMQGDSSLLDYLMAVRVYNDTAEQCIAARSGLATATAELLRAIGL